MVGASGFEPEASCAQGSCRKSILLVRLALFYVTLHGFGANSAVVGPKLDPSFPLRPGRRQARSTLGNSAWIIVGQFWLTSTFWLARVAPSTLMVPAPATKPPAPCSPLENIQPVG